MEMPARVTSVVSVLTLSVVYRRKQNKGHSAYHSTMFLVLGNRKERTNEQCTRAVTRSNSGCHYRSFLPPLDSGSRFGQSALIAR